MKIQFWSFEEAAVAKLEMTPRTITLNEFEESIISSLEYSLKESVVDLQDIIDRWNEIIKHREEK